MRTFLTAGLILCHTAALMAQICPGSGRYRERIFPQVTRTADVHFATVQALPAVYLNETQTVTQNLYLDVFEPTGDTLQKRPLVILAFGGAFVIGTKNDADIQAACDSLSHLGYVTVSIQYRLGLNPTNAASGERAVYRSAQDYSAAVRYFKQYAAQYRIDTNAIFVGGASAGSFAAMHMAFGEEDERPASTYASGGLFPMPDLGCFDCSGNTYNHSHRVRGILNMWGALGYLDWIEPGDPPIVSFHGDMDPLVPYSQGYPFTVGATLPYVYGSAKIDERMGQLGIHHEFYTYQSAIHQLWGGATGNIWAFGPTEFQVPILNGIRQFLYNQLKPAPTALTGADSVCTGNEEWYQVPLRPGFRYCWQVQNGQVLQQNNHKLQVRWNNAGTGQVYVREFNPYDIPTDSVLLKSVSIYTTPEVHVAGDSQLCTGDTAQLTATGADSYQWWPASVSDPTAATVAVWPGQNTVYTVTGTAAGGCTGQATWAVQVNPYPVAPIITRFDTVLYIPEQYQSYQWYLNGQALPGATQNTVAITQAGTYTVYVGQGLGCYIFSYPFTVNSPAGLQETAGQPTVTVYPNPFTETITLAGTGGPVEIQISTVTGQTVYGPLQLTDNPTGHTLYLPALAPGVYLLTLGRGHTQQRIRIVRQ